MRRVLFEFTALAGAFQDNARAAAGRAGRMVARERAVHTHGLASGLTIAGEKLDQCVELVSSYLLPLCPHGVLVTHTCDVCDTPLT
jgi:hypothetical protein